MKIGLAQINTTVGDLDGNAARIGDAYRSAVEQGAELVVTPELSITGYPPQDLVFKSSFVARNLAVLDQLADMVGEVPLVVGFVAPNESGAGPPFFNAAALLRKGHAPAVVHKSLLPTYDVFDEARYFQPGESVAPIEVGGKRVGITICEDIWTEDHLPARLYVRNPPAALAEQGIDFLLNLSASPFHAGKPVERYEMLQSVAKSLNTLIVYCNAVGGNDRLVFDGNSQVVNAKGELLEQLPAFEETVRVIDLSAAPKPFVPSDRSEEIFNALTTGVRDYLRKCGFKSAIIGLSGGIDSALTAAVAVEALGPENVMGVTMPSQYSSGGSVSDSEALAKNLGIRCETIAIREAFETFKGMLQPVFGDRPEDLAEENMQARIRGVILMSISNKLGHLLLTTGNKSELAVGYCTIYGDMCGGLAVISDLPKMTVYEVSRWINRDREIIPWNTIDKAPSAELRPDQKDEDSLPPYPLLDEILELYVEQAMTASDIIASGYDDEMVRWIARQVDINEWKRHQAAPGLRVTSKAFGSGRRMPIAQRFVD
ncbi:MAG: NAD+ synthase (glutamine-hydrolyzing) [Verrucomicrobiales bacterium]|jgi:NAD+ synthase (glutamine-hydrolysing)